MTAPATDFELIERTLQGEHFAYDELMKRYERLVFRVAIGFGRGREDALDITQNTFLKAFKALGRFRKQANFKTWLVRIAYNESISWTRSHRRHSEQRGTVETFDAIAGTEIDQEKQLLSQEETRQMFQSLGKIHRRYRLALILRYYHDLSVREIAEILECSEGVVKNALFRGVRYLRQHMTATY